MPVIWSGIVRICAKPVCRNERRSLPQLTHSSHGVINSASGHQYNPAFRGVIGSSNHMVEERTQRRLAAILAADMDETTAIERVLRRDRLIVLSGLLAIAVLAWIFVLEGAGTGMSVIAMTTWRFPPPLAPLANEPWPAHYWLIMLLMWWAMMVAMMTPSAAPMVLLYARVVRRAQKKGQMARAVVPTAWFVLGYLTVWLAFSAVAVVVQWTLEREASCTCC